MIANYHTHTPRCHHAVGDERAYVENAIKSGFEILGFSDHSPQFFPDGHISGMRMLPDEADGYATKVKGLSQEYKEKIKIFTGFEAEYFEDCFESLRTLCKQKGIDYLILGQHFLNDEYGFYVGEPNSDAEMLKKHTDIMIKGINTGCFSYIAHPDIFNYKYDDKYYKTEMSKLCQRARELDVPLELNMLGLITDRHYPSEKFFKIAADVGNEIIIGFDAHEPDALLNTDGYKKCKDFAEKLNLNLIDKIEFKKI